MISFRIINAADDGHYILTCRNNKTTITYDKPSCTRIIELLGDESQVINKAIVKIHSDGLIELTQLPKMPMPLQDYVDLMNVICRLTKLTFDKEAFFKK